MEVDPFDRPPVVQLLEDFSTFYGTRGLITMFTGALHWSLCWARPIPFCPSKIQFNTYPPTYVLVFLVASFLLAFPPICYMHFSSPPFILHPLHVKLVIAFYLIIMSIFAWLTLTVKHTSLELRHRGICTLVILFIPLLCSHGQRSWLQIQRSGFDSPALPDFLRSSGSETGSTQPRKYSWGATWKKVVAQV
jgi:hypothetical protein